ncbi:ATP-binding cassette sub-family C member 3 isoform X1 [Tachysurus fulvidraco]|uniref:ATP-binding cassette sub-family C member 3 isoform X1 n=2 Tax=Tachysurus fulvidraco TaxID=1234273 RepID=UPI000F4E5C3E|nr:ATP-binding cassette sub-family C member 3 isoform X1 [Tachysurus fulvidraco]
MEQLCGSELPFWDLNLTLYHENPDLTECFQLSVLPWIPCIYLWVVFPFYFICLKMNNRGYIMMSILNRIKTIFGIILWIVCWTDLFGSFSEMKEKSIPPIYFVTPLILGMTMLLATFLIQYERLKGVQSSGVLFIFWMISVLCAIVPFRSKILQARYGDEVKDKLRFTTFYMYFGLIVAELILSCFNEKPPLFSNVVTVPNPCPELSAGFLSRMTFWWFTSMAIKGYKSPLENKDLWSLNKEDSSEVVVPKLLKEWELEESKLQRSVQEVNGQAVFSKAEPEANHVGVNPEEVEVLLSKKKKESQQPSFLRALLRAFGPYFLIGSAFKLLQDVVVFINPQLLRMLIGFTEKKNVPSWWGFALAFLMFGCALLQTLILHQHFQYCFVTGMRLRTAIIGAIYRKSLIITNEAKRSSTVGEIVNLMSVDAQRFMDLTTFLNMLWSAPLQIILALVFLWQTLGPSVLAGVAVMVLLIPFNAVIAMKTRAYQVEQMQYKDARIKLMNEILNGMKVLKLYAWEKSFKEKILHIRQKELSVLRKSSYLSALSVMAWTSAPFLVALTTFAVYVNVDKNNVLDADKAFVSLALFNILRFPLNMLPQVISSIMQASVSLKRIQQFLSHDELDPESVDRKPEASEYAVTVVNGKFSWAKKDPAALQNINVLVPQGSLLAVVGNVGCGKTSLLSALLGEMEKLEGHVSIRGSVAYVPQQAWIQNATLRDNILFGRPYIEDKYRRVMDACALTPDLDILPGGDQTEIGEKGINLSGGQRQRVSLARALYSEADVYLLDDSLSAVDAHVAKHIFDNVIGPEGALRQKTRILVTHSISFLPQVDNIMVIVEGRVSEMGSYQDLLNENGAFAEFLRNYTLEEIMEDDEVTEVLIDEEELFPDDALSIHTDMVDQEPAVNEARRQFMRQISIMSNDMENPRTKSVRKRRLSEKRHGEPPPEKESKVQKLIQAETTETGRVKIKVYWEYVKAVGPLMSLLICFLYAAQSAASIGANIWLAMWTTDTKMNNREENTQMRVGVYAALGIAQGVLILANSLLSRAYGMLKAAHFTHLHMLGAVLRAPPAFFESNPSGRVLNRFGKDVDTIDCLIPENVDIWMRTFWYTVTVLVICSALTPMFFIVIVPLMMFYWWVQRFYVATSRQLKRLESVSRSPIYSHFSETITGASVIRAYRLNTSFVYLSDLRVDENQKSYYPGIVSNRWLGVRIEFIGNCIVLFAALFAVIGKDSLSEGLVGLSVTYALQVTMSLNWMVRMTSDLESNIVAVERVKEYSETPPEAPWDVEDKKPSPDWPAEGNVEFTDYSVRYREELDLVLKNISLKVKGGEKIGIVGRTGAGKSSMTLCLFRLLEAAKGEISIDGVKIAEIGLHDLRSKLTIIPQEPVLFSGTLRMNLDPFEKYTDDDLWNALKLSHLHKFVNNQPAKLELECSEGGENLSVGQRQLVCLARALLRKTRILVLDEATAAVDLETDDLIQSTIRTQFEDCTVFTIAHRLNTIMDYTRVLVLDKGQIAEFDTPANLIAQKGIFHGMAKDAGLV